MKVTGNSSGHVIWENEVQIIGGIRERQQWGADNPLPEPVMEEMQPPTGRAEEADISSKESLILIWKKNFSKYTGFC